ncbi:signal peptidase II [Lactococcus allomyrinae]|uniref:Lipoprotein signal peptidase n=1 Tax=Lactococcus allomyrinae TaxID=2419773 RepID=A0A387BED9_9LACT|nr:signal peptidase II [Lactococcus allomyrinae]AYG00432.1 signal peptidase II [Lactococcus allomyrinae]
MKKILSLVIIAVGILLDQLFKHWVVTNIPLGHVKNFLPGIMSLTYLQNNGAAWSSFEGQQWFFLILTPIVLIVAAYFLWKKMEQNWYFFGLTLIISGALGNFIDRVRQGFVVDMFQTDFMNFPIFNIADSLLSVGFVVLFVAILLDKDEKTNRTN